METYTVVVFNKAERQIMERVVTSLGLVSDHPDDERARAIKALGRNGVDATHELLQRAIRGLMVFVEVCERESSVEYWTHRLSAMEGPITPETPGDGLVLNPYQACVTLAESRRGQLHDGQVALDLCREALQMTDPRPERVTA